MVLVVVVDDCTFVTLDDNGGSFTPNAELADTEDITALTVAIGNGLCIDGFDVGAVVLVVDPFVDVRPIDDVGADGIGITEFG